MRVRSLNGEKMVLVHYRERLIGLAFREAGYGGAQRHAQASSVTERNGPHNECNGIRSVEITERVKIRKTATRKARSYLFKQTRER